MNPVRFQLKASVRIVLEKHSSLLSITIILSPSCNTHRPNFICFHSHLPLEPVHLHPISFLLILILQITPEAYLNIRTYRRLFALLMALAAPALCLVSSRRRFLRRVFSRALGLGARGKRVQDIPVKKYIFFILDSVWRSTNYCSTCQLFFKSPIVTLVS